MMIPAFYLSFLTLIYPILILPPYLCQYITLKYIAFDQNKKQIPHYDDHCILFIILTPIYPILILPPCLCQYITLKYIA